MPEIVTVAMFATHWSPNEHNQIGTRCNYCGAALGVVISPMPWSGWRPYTRVVINQCDNNPQGMFTTDNSHWCPECWVTYGRPRKQAEFPDAQFQEVS